MIHDFDMVRFLSGEEPVAVMAAGSTLFHADAEAVGDVDTSAVTLKLKSGALCQLNHSRRAVYGHDQRIEAHGSKGMLISTNHPRDGVERYTAETTAARSPLIESSRDRYRQAYTNELADFIDAVEKGREPSSHGRGRLSRPANRRSRDTLMEGAGDGADRLARCRLPR